MNKEKNLKLNGKYAIEKSADKNYKKVAYSYEYKDTHLKYFVYVPTVNGKTDSYYIAQATNQVEEANKSGKLLKYSKKYYGDVRHHTRKVVIVSTICVVAGAVLLGGGHCAYKFVNGWKEMSDTDFKTYSETIRTKQLTMKLPESGKVTLPIGDVVPSTNGTMDMDIAHFSYDLSNGYVETEQEFYKDGKLHTVNRYIWGTIVSDKYEIYRAFGASSEDKSAQKIRINTGTYFDSMEKAKEYIVGQTIKNPTDDELSVSNIDELIRSTSTGVQFYAADGNMDAIYKTFNTIKENTTGKADLSRKYYKKNTKEGSMKIEIKFDVDGEFTAPYTNEKSPIKGNGKVVFEMYDYLISNFSMKFNIENEYMSEEPIVADVSLSSTYNSKDINNNDWKAWDILEP